MVDGCVIEADKPAQKVPRSHQLVLDVLTARQRHGYSDTTDHEIVEMLEVLHAPRRFDTGWVSARVAEMVKAGRVVQSEQRREDAKTKKNALTTGRTVVVRAVFIPAKQARLVA